MIENNGEKSKIIKLIKQSQTKEEFKNLLIDLVNLLVVDNVDINELKKILGCSLFPNNITNIENTKSIEKSDDKDDKKELEDLEEYIKNSEEKHYKPQSKSELIDIINELMDKNGCDCDLNFIDTSKITDMSKLFASSELRFFNGDISKWDVSNVICMQGMFYGSEFTGDISKWNVSNVKDMREMFRESFFNGDISKWNVSNVKDMSYMFIDADFNQDIGDWDVSNVKNMSYMFAREFSCSTYHCPWEKFTAYENDWAEEHIYRFFNQDISRWNIFNVKNASYMFFNNRIFNQDLSSWKMLNCPNHKCMFSKCPLEKKPEYQPKFED